VIQRHVSTGGQDRHDCDNRIKRFDGLELVLLPCYSPQPLNGQKIMLLFVWAEVREIYGTRTEISSGQCQANPRQVNVGHCHLKSKRNVTTWPKLARQKFLPRSTLLKIFHRLFTLRTHFPPRPYSTFFSCSRLSRRRTTYGLLFCHALLDHHTVSFIKRRHCSSRRAPRQLPTLQLSPAHYFPSPFSSPTLIVE
jgi:hypothetical protein